MDTNGFKELIGSANKRKLVVGTLVFSFGAFFLWLVLFGAKAETTKVNLEGQIILWVIIIMSMGFGGLMSWTGLTALQEIKTGKNDLIKAIEKGDSDYVVWFYENITQSNNGERDYQLWIYAADNTSYQFTVKKGRINEVMEFLAERFPNAHVGYTEAISNKFNTKQRV
ncbi:MAG: hypothetical protein HUJ25_02920 [Crocinitomicaceae bacterium]|nr:hypothetical protein [Crocinitomicaceae bacterium]